MEGDSLAVVEELRATVSELNQRIIQMEAEHAAQLDSMSLQYAVDLELVRSGAKNVKAVRGLISLPDGVKAGEDGSVPGLREAIDAVKQSDSYLFDDAAELKISGATPAESDGNLPDFSGMTYSEISDFLIRNPGFELGIGGVS